MNTEEMKTYTKEFAKRAIRLCRRLPATRDGRLVGDQLFRSATSVGANYRAACRARSRADFISKLGIALEEADETHFWLEIISEERIVDPGLVSELLENANALMAILVASINTAKQGKGSRPG